MVFCFEVLNQGNLTIRSEFYGVSKINFYILLQRNIKMPNFNCNHFKKLRKIQYFKSLTYAVAAKIQKKTSFVLFLWGVCKMSYLTCLYMYLDKTNVPSFDWVFSSIKVLSLCWSIVFKCVF